MRGRSGGESVEDGAGDELGREAGEAFHGVGQGAIRFHARHARERTILQGEVGLAVGSGAAGFGGAEEADDGFAEGSCDVHGAGVVGDEEVAAAEGFDHAGQGGAAGEIDCVRAGGLEDGLGEGLVMGSAEDDEAQAGLLTG